VKKYRKWGLEESLVGTKGKKGTKAGPCGEKAESRRGGTRDISAPKSSGRNKGEWGGKKRAPMGLEKVQQNAFGGGRALEANYLWRKIVIRTVGR